MSRTFKEQNDWEKTVNAGLDHQDSSIDATLKAQKHRIENLISKFDNSLASSTVRFEELESKSNGQQELTGDQSAKIADMEIMFQLFRDDTKVLKTKRSEFEKFEKQLIHSESLVVVDEYTAASAMLVEKEIKTIYTKEQIERRRLQQYERETETPNGRTALDRIVKAEKVTEEFAKQLRDITSLIDDLDDFQIMYNNNQINYSPFNIVEIFKDLRNFDKGFKRILKT